MAILERSRRALGRVTLTATLYAALGGVPVAAASPSPATTGLSVERPAAAEQPVACWIEEVGFVGASARYLRPDSTQAEEYIGFVGTDRVLQSWLDDMSTCLRAHGDVTVRANGTLGPMPEGAWVFLASRSASRRVELHITPAGDGFEYVWSVDGQARPMDSEGEAWRDSLLAAAADYWLLFARVQATGAEIARIAQDLESIGSAREGARARALTVQADRSAEAAYRALVEEYDRRVSGGQPQEVPASIEAAIAELTVGGLGHTATITQDALTLTITRSEAAGGFRGVYNLDGSESRNTLRVGDRSVEMVSRARWVGNHLMITTSLTLEGEPLEATMTLSLDPSGTLVVASATAPGRSAEPVMTTRLYRKS